MAYTPKSPRAGNARPRRDDRSERPARPGRRPFRDEESEDTPAPRPAHRYGDRRVADRNDRPARDTRPTHRYGERDDRPARQTTRPARRYDEREPRPARPYGGEAGRERPARPKRGNRTERPFRGGRPERSGYENRTDRREERPVRRPQASRAAADTPERAAAKKSGAIRLNRYIALSGVCSRREADDLIATGAVTVNGQICTVMGTLVRPEDKVVVGGQRLKAEKKVYLLMNKPKGYITTLDDPQQRHTVMELIQDACSERIYPVGRLDRNTTGVLLFTNDGDLAKKLTHPSHGARKIYHVGLDKPFAKADMEALLHGLTLEDGPIEVDDAEYVEDSHRKEVGIQIHSGRNRIVRRIFEHLGYTVCKLDRVLFAELTKKNLARGEWRFLTEAEVRFLQMNK